MRQRPISGAVLWVMLGLLGGVIMFMGYHWLRPDQQLTDEHNFTEVDR